MCQFYEKHCNRLQNHAHFFEDNSLDSKASNLSEMLPRQNLVGKLMFFVSALNL